MPPIPKGGNTMFKHVLVPLDFTEKNDPAIGIAQEMAASAGSRLTLLHGIEAIEGVADEEMQEY